jgi:serine/threonine protein kinase
MSAQPRVTKASSWTVLEGHVVDGIFPLRRFLGGSNHSAVFLTEYKSQNLTDAAIKFIRADTSRADAKLLQWQAAARLSHPHLLRLFHSGRCQFGGKDFLFVVMEYAEQTLAQVLAGRALTPAEAREMLPPTLDALAYLHQNQLIHGHLKTSNVLAVNDQLKLASDTIRSSSNAPSDIWAFGLTLTEALTQRAPV